MAHKGLMKNSTAFQAYLFKDVQITPNIWNTNFTH